MTGIDYEQYTPQAQQTRRIQALEAEVRQLTAQLAHAQQAVEEAFAAGQAEYRRRCEILEEDIRRRLVALLDGFKWTLPAAPEPPHRSEPHSERNLS
jgi:hypothetical protein